MILSWDICPTGEPPDRYRVEYAHIYVIGSVPGVDDAGGLVIMPLYSAWEKKPIQESPALSAVIPCEPGRGELCAGIVTSLDLADNEDNGVCE